MNLLLVLHWKRLTIAIENGYFYHIKSANYDGHIVSHYHLSPPPWGL